MGKPKILIPCPMCGSSILQVEYDITICRDCKTEAPTEIWNAPRNGDAQKTIDAAVAFEIEVKQILGKYLGEGLALSNGLGVLALIQAELSGAFIQKVNTIPIGDN